MQEEVSEVFKSAQVECSLIFPMFNISSTATTISENSKGIKRNVYNDDTDSINDDNDEATIEMGLLPSNNATSSSLISVKDHSGNLRYSTNELQSGKKGGEAELEVGISRRHSVSVSFCFICIFIYAYVYVYICIYI
jgi:hypothetical protein